MKFTLVHTFPNGTERPVSVPMPTIGKAAALAAQSLHDNRRATKDEARSFADHLTTMPVGRSLTHWPSRYAARIECAETITAPDPSSLRITKVQKVTDLNDAEAETWEVRTGGPHSLRTVYRRWVADGHHWATADPVMLDSGSFFTGGGPRQHKAGDLYAWTVQGDGRKRPFYILAPERQLPQDAPTNAFLLPAK
ncbi:hypothetical protein [Streptomyces candidus]|uniref:Uncharacterized protein n=1 Tax=Streptomyces candidus TaxID=67283 RepID=A0A7X0LTF6_9ACTN|nr:hypothetical protein [Streptomyces candidus]MBB6439379.1 hypothetical protein [Streptomyces candidus]GHH54973.1 hypothetical protein GCM10018773_58780 [Streptomyces candidus]